MLAEQRPMRATSPKVRILLFVVALVFVVRIVATYPILSNTIDAPHHIAAGLDYLRTGVYNYEPQHPPLARLAVAALPLFLADLKLGTFNQVWAGDWVEKDIRFYWHTLTLARLGNLPFALLLLVVAFLWTRDLFGPRAGTAAALIASCSPNLLAHAGVATLDIAAAATFSAACYTTWLWSRTSNWFHCCLAAAAVSGAVLSKFSTLAFLPPVLIAYILMGRWRDGPTGLLDKRSLVQFAAFGGMSIVLIWSVYGFDYGVLDRGSRATLDEAPAPRGTIEALATDVVRGSRLPAPMLWRGAVQVMKHNRVGHRAYLLGETSLHGWWYYFPVVLAVKTTLPLLILAAIGTFLLRGESSPAGALWSLLLPIASVLGVSMAANINIGVRHILPLYPFLAMLAAVPFRGDQPLLRPLRRSMVLFCLLLCWHVAESFAAHPDYLPYFNQIAHGRESDFLADSNLDWGQDLARLALYTQDQQLPVIFVAAWGRDYAHKFGITHGLLPPDDPACCWVAAGVNQLKGVVRPNMSHLDGRRPVTRVGRSIYVYKLEPEEVQDLRSLDLP